MNIYEQFDRLASAMLGTGQKYTEVAQLIAQLELTDNHAQSVERNTERAKIAEQAMRAILPPAPTGMTIDPACGWGLLWHKQYWRELYRGKDKEQAKLLADWLAKFVTSGRYQKCLFVKDRINTSLFKK